MSKIAIVTGSTRPGRVNQSVAHWVLAKAEEFGGADYELVDIVDFNLPILDEPFPAAYQNYQNDHTKAFAAKMSEFDGYIFIVGEYNHSVQPALANALSYLNAELNNKAAGMVGYGSAMGSRAVEHLRGILSELQIAHVQKTGMFSLFTDFENFSTFAPTEQSAGSVQPMLEQLLAWSKAMATVRDSASVNA
ncbi:NADPH-dependent FMN reductase [Glutamicibacter nicotianae]|uniref:FMN reductase n=1 Tax=Glutamicibacter nicotianae TaxID=37929 RepID=A0ABQ0RQQ6_GLUNI|nr:NADPH-dependent FMN reductase [Glutamicibacter nicotianae]GEC13826.1 FMN reductase [Glutamicibacter nicotianae]